MEQNDLHIKSGFKIPEDYFDDFKGNLMNVIELNELLSKKDGFKVPPDYFEKSQVGILKLTTKKTVINLLSIRYVAVACFLLILLTSSMWIFVNQNDKLQFSDLTSTEIQRYLSETYSEDKSYVILEYLQAIKLDDLLAIENQNEELIEAYISEYDYNFQEDY